MADDKSPDKSPHSSNVDSLIDRLKLEISKESDDNILETRKLTIHPTSNRHGLTTNSAQDINKEITELENLIKKLQNEIVEMTKSANKPMPNFESDYVDDNDDDENEDDSGKNQESKHEPVKKTDGKKGFKFSKGSDIIFPIIIKDDSVLEEQAKMLAANMANLIKVSDPENDTLDDVRRNFSMLWDDDVIPNYVEDVLEDLPTISDIQPRSLNDPSLKPSDIRTKLIDNVFKESFDAMNVDALEEYNINYPIDLKGNPEIQKTNDDNIQPKSNDPGSTEFKAKAPMVSESRNRKPTIIMQANTPNNPLKDNIKKLHHEKDSETTPVTVVDNPTEMKSQIPSKIENTDIKKDAICSNIENTTISCNTSDNPCLPEKPSTKTESYSIMKTLRRFVGKDNDEGQTQDSSSGVLTKVNNSTETDTIKSTSKTDTTIIKNNNPIIDARNIITAITQDILPKLMRKESSRKEIDHDTSTVTEGTMMSNPTSNYEVNPCIVKERPVPSAPCANSEDAKFIKDDDDDDGDDVETIITDTVDTKGTNQQPQAIKNISKLIAIQDPDISSSRNTIPEAFNKNLVNDAKVKKGEAIETHLVATEMRVGTTGRRDGTMDKNVVMTDGLAEGDIQNKCESVGNDQDIYEDEDDEDDDEDEEGDDDNAYDVD